MAFRKKFALLLFLSQSSLLLLLFPFCSSNESLDCPSSSCGSLKNISFPFRLKDDPKNCGDPSYELACENNQTIFYMNFKRFLVLSISYQSFTVRLVDPGLAKYQGYSSCPLHYLTFHGMRYYYMDLNKVLMYVSCGFSLNSSLYYESVFCGDSPLTTQQNYSYAFLRDYPLGLEEIQDSCSVEKVTLVSEKAPEVGNTQFSDYSYGFVISWMDVDCKNCDTALTFCNIDIDKNIVFCENYCNFYTVWKLSPIRLKFKCGIHLVKGGIGLVYDFFTSVPELLSHPIVRLYIGMAFGARWFLGILLLFALVVYKKRRMHLSMYETIENFLQGQNNLVPIRYRYAEIKRMTHNFRDKLGEGGYGTVFKGKLRSGLLVAIKMMGKSKASGEEFISEVATIGRIHHVNVVNLVGFCFEGTKRALVYEFMPNGSLEKYIFPQEGEMKSSSWEKMFKISLGVAQGMDYLHRGCEMQILHFDIKPHNILLDENFYPKISDFGLAKLYPADESIVSLTAARGTMGYMAPELFYKNIGRVSYKADVYSFGMLLMEMAGKRKNLNPFVDHLSQIYFPSWVHDQFSQGKEIEMGDATEDERKLVKKMILIALWCIQMKPTDRPSMNKVVEMLEGDLELLEMPAKPFLSPEGMQDDHQDQEIHRNNAELPLLSNGNRDSSSLDVAI